MPTYFLWDSNLGIIDESTDLRRIADDVQALVNELSEGEDLSLMDTLQLRIVPDGQGEVITHHGQDISLAVKELLARQSK